MLLRVYLCKHCEDFRQSSITDPDFTSVQNEMCTIIWQHCSGLNGLKTQYKIAIAWNDNLFRFTISSDEDVFYAYILIFISDEKVNHKRGYKIFAAWLTFRTFNLVFYYVIIIMKIISTVNKTI